MKRLHRLTSILIKLQASKSLKVRKLSEEYNVTPRTIYRDLKALEDAGVPIGYEPGEDYFLLEGYQIPPIHFTSEEAIALITGKALVDQNSDSSLVTKYAKAIEKVLAVLPSGKKKDAFMLEGRLAPSTQKKNSSSDTLISIQKAITEFQRIEMNYVNAQKIMSSRKVEPLALYFTQDHWILIAFCLLKQDHREFRLDRITDLKVIPEYFPPNSFALNNYFKKYQ